MSPLKVNDTNDSNDYKQRMTHAELWDAPDNGGSIVGDFNSEKSVSGGGDKYKLSVLFLTLVAVVGMWAVSGEADAKPSWALLYDAMSDKNAIFSLDAVDEKNAWAVGVEDQGGNTASIGLKTATGEHFGMMPLPSVGGGQLEITMFLAVEFADTQNGWLFSTKFSMGGEEHTLWKSDSGGMSWSEAYTPSVGIMKMQALPTGHFYAVGKDILLMSADGESYSEVTVPVPGGHELENIFMFNADCGFTVASTDPLDGPATSAVLWTDDGGQSWETRAQELPYVLGGISFVTSDLGWIAATGESDGFILKTTDGGISWTPQSLPDHDNPLFGSDPSPVTDCVDVRFFDDMRGVALCLACTGNCDPADEDSPTYFTVLSWTSNGGDTWEMDPDYEEHMVADPFGDMARASGMLAMAFPTPNAGFMAGQNNLILGFSADDPEEAAWPSPECSENTNTNENTNNNSNANNNENGSSVDDDTAQQLSGCGCRKIQAGTPTPFFMILLLLGIFAWCLKVRAKTD